MKKKLFGSKESWEKADGWQTKLATDIWKRESVIRNYFISYEVRLINITVMPEKV